MKLSLVSLVEGVPRRTVWFEADLKVPKELDAQIQFSSLEHRYRLELMFERETERVSKRESLSKLKLVINVGKACCDLNNGGFMQNFASYLNATITRLIA